ncbi:hypothetical protein GN956_G22430 [Arapaima gigas]
MRWFHLLARQRRVARLGRFLGESPLMKSATSDAPDFPLAVRSGARWCPPRWPGAPPGSGGRTSGPHESHVAGDLPQEAPPSDPDLQPRPPALDGLKRSNDLETLTRRRGPPLPCSWDVDMLPKLLSD